MSNIILCYTNRADSATLAGGSWSGALPLANLKNSDISKVARSSDATLASTQFTIDMGAAKTVRAIALVGHNLSTAGKWKLTSSDAAYNSGWLNAVQLTFRGDTPSNWGAQYALIHVPANALSARYLQIEIDDTANTAGYVQAGRLVIMNGLQPAKNASYGLRSGRTELSTVETTPSGKRFPTVRRRPRKETFTLNWLTQTEADQVHEFQAEVGITEEVLYIPNPADAAFTQRYGFLGYMRELSEIEFPYVLTRSVALQLEEKV